MPIEFEAIQRAAAAFIPDRHRLGAFVNGLLRDVHAAEDMLQEVWVRLAAEVVADSAVLETFLDRVELAFAEVGDDTADWAERQQAPDECVATLPERSRQIGPL